jgi:hypothetical protein
LLVTTPTTAEVENINSTKKAVDLLFLIPFP